MKAKNTSLSMYCVGSGLPVYTAAIYERKQKRRRFRFLLNWVATHFQSESLPVVSGFSCLFSMLHYFKTINIANVICSLFLTGKMPFSVIQHRRHRLALVMMVHLFNLQVRSLWIHPINNLRFEKGEFFLLYPDLRKYEDKFFRVVQDVNQAIRSSAQYS